MPEFVIVQTMQKVLIFLKIMDDAIYAAQEIETLYYGDYKRRIKVILFTDSEPTLDSIASSKQVERKTLRPTILGLKERLFNRDI